MTIARWWGLALALWALALWPNGGTNPSSRFATMRGICSDLPHIPTFNIDAYHNTTIDWAQTPDGHYYSNKAPGPMLVAAPLYCLLQPLILKVAHATDSDEGWIQIHYPVDVLFSILFQIIPWAFSLAFIVYALQDRLYFKLEESAMFMAAATLGTTLTIFFPSFFGHAFSAWLWLLVLASFILENNILLGFVLGFSLLSDYAVAFAFPAVILAVLIRERWSWSAILNCAWQIILGALFPAILWCWYHVAAFGSPLALPQKFQNPAFVDLAEQKAALWGVISFFPKPSVLWELLFGSIRGLLYTQPWILWILIGAMVGCIKIRQKAPLLKALDVLIIGSFLGFLVMNASFGAWHGGGTAGPRYISPVLPLFALLWLLQLREADNFYKYVSYGLLGYSILFQFFAHATMFIPNPTPLIPYLLTVAQKNFKHFLLSFSVQIAFWTAFLFLFWRRYQDE